MHNSEESKADLLGRIRERPALFLGDRTITALWQFLLGYGFARQELGAGPPSLLPPDINDWIAYRLHFQNSTSGWRQMILDRVPDEALALERFFELLDDHHARKPRDVAAVRERQTRDDFPSTTFSLIVYTDDPGFFASAVAPGRISHDTGSFFPFLQWLLGPGWEGNAEFLSVFDQSALDRLIREDEEHEKQSREELEARQRIAP